MQEREQLERADTCNRLDVIAHAFEDGYYYGSIKHALNEVVDVTKQTGIIKLFI